MPPAGRHVTLQGVLNDIEEDRGLVYIQDISFTHVGETIQAEAPTSKLKHFDWYGKGKQKWAHYAKSTEENAAGPSGLSSKWERILCSVSAQRKVMLMINMMSTVPIFSIRIALRLWSHTLHKHTITTIVIDIEDEYFCDCWTPSCMLLICRTWWIDDNEIVQDAMVDCIAWSPSSKHPPSCMESAMSTLQCFASLIWECFVLLPKWT